MSRTALLALILISSGLNAEVANVKTSNVDVTQVHEVDIDKNGRLPKWSVWGLSEQEWSRYEYIMRETPRGQQSPDINPIQALGLEARTHEERTRYAEMQALMVAERQHKEILWQAYVAQAHESPAVANLDNHFSEKLNTYLHSIGGLVSGNDNRWEADDEMFIFVDTHCHQSCLGLTRKVRQRNEGTSHIFVANALSDSDVRSWAQKMNIPPELVSHGAITLNHAQNHLQSLGYSSHQLPLVLVRSTESETGYVPLHP